MSKKIMKIALFFMLLFITPLTTQAATKSTNVNTWYTDNLATSNTINEYNFQLNSAGYISLTLKHEYIDSSSAYWRARIYNSNGEVVLERKFKGNLTEIETTKIGLPAGAYTLKIDDSYFSDITYMFKINFTSANNWEKELNDSASTATTISANQEIHGSLEDSIDVDYYKVSLSSAGYISLTFKHEYIDSSSFYWKARVCNSIGDVVLERKFKGNSTETETTKIGLPAGMYTLIIEEYYASDIPYTFKINYTSSNYWEKEINNTTAKATAIQLNTTMNGSLSDSSDNDFYEIVLNKAQNYMVNFAHDYIDTGSSIWTLKILNSTGSVVLEQRFAGNKTNDAVSVYLSAGTYIIKIEKYYFYDNVYSFSICDTSQKKFTDVISSDYYFDSVKWAVEESITDGTSNTTFSPNGTCTRAQVVTFLWRAAGAPSVSATNPFKDVAKGSYYYTAVLWAVKNGITDGTSNNTFTPEATCTRAQVVTFLWRYAGCPSISGSIIFGDVSKNNYYYKAVLWAVKSNITQGVSSNSFLPDTICTRAQVVTFLYRYYN